MTELFNTLGQFQTWSRIAFESPTRVKYIFRTFNSGALSLSHAPAILPNSGRDLVVHSWIRRHEMLTLYLNSSYARYAQIQTTSVQSASGCRYAQREASLQRRNRLLILPRQVVGMNPSKVCNGVDKAHSTCQRCHTVAEANSEHDEQH